MAMLKERLAEFNHLMQGIEKVYADYAKSVGLTYMSLTVLQIIFYTETPPTQKEICEQSHYNKQIVNAIVKGFADRGYLRFAQVPDDRRNKLVLLTDSGKQYAGSVLQPLWELEQKALSVLTDQEWEAGLQMLQRCYDNFQSVQKA